LSGTKAIQDGTTKALEEHRAWVVPLQGLHAGRVYVVKDTLTMGADRSCDLVLEGKDIAKRHVLIERRAKAWRIKNLAGEKRTKLGEDWLGVDSDFELRDDSRIVVGGFTFVFKCLHDSF
jgi:hypothetical protein